MSEEINDQQATQPDVIKSILKDFGYKDENDTETAQEPERRVPANPDGTFSLPPLDPSTAVDIPPELLQQALYTDPDEPAPEKERVRNTAQGLFNSPEVSSSEFKDPWSRTLPQLGKVSVSMAELDQYTKSMLFDERFQLPIRLRVGDLPFVVEARSLYMSEREVMALAVAEVAKNYPVQTIQNAAVVAEYYLKIALLVQIVSVNGKSFDAFDARPEPGTLPENSPKVQELAQLARTRFGEMHQAKMKTLIRALHTFETKQQILEDAYHNRDFRPPVDAY